MGFSGPTLRDLQDGANRLGLPPISSDIAATMRAALDKSVAAMQQLDAMPDPVVPGADMSPRSPGRAPRADGKSVWRVGLAGADHRVRQGIAGGQVGWDQG